MGGLSEPMLIVTVAAVIFLATLIRSAFGFGEALVSVPLLALVIPVEVATPLAVLFSITVAGIIVAQDWRSIHLGSAGRLVVATMFGIPLGLLMLTRVPEPVVKGGLALVIIAFSTYSLVGRSRAELRDDRLAWLFGFGAGVLGGAYGMNGPPLVLYGALRGWSAGQFRATLQGYFLPASLVGMVGYWMSGLWVPDVTRYYLIALIPAVVAILLGRTINQRMEGRAFVRYVHAGLIVVGMVLLIQTFGSGGESSGSPTPETRPGSHDGSRPARDLRIVARRSCLPLPDPEGGSIVETLIAELISKVGLDQATAEKVVQYLKANAHRLPELLQSDAAKSVMENLPGGLGGMLGGGKS